MIASTTRSHCASFARSSSRLPSSIADARSTSMKDAGFDFFMRSTPARAGPFRSPSLPGTSSSTTGMPADAANAAIPAPIVPAPTIPNLRMRIRKLGIVGAGTMGAGIAALAASAGIPVVLLDVPGKDGDRNGPARAGVERMKKSKPASFMDVDRASAIELGNLDDDLAKLAQCDLVVEAIIEQLEPKQALYAKLEQLLPEHTIV